MGVKTGQLRYQVISFAQRRFQREELNSGFRRTMYSRLKSKTINVYAIPLQLAVCLMFVHAIYLLRFTHSENENNTNISSTNPFILPKECVAFSWTFGCITDY